LVSSKKYISKAAALLLWLSFLQLSITQAQLKLWYNKPATQWVEALPIGNGRIGGMVFGGVEKELIQLNESTLWSGGPVKNNVNPGAPSFLPQIRQALMKDQDYSKANQLSKKIQGLYSESYMPLGDITIMQDFAGVAPTFYYRDLNIQNAVATTLFTINGINYKREIFTSAPANVMVIHITASKKSALHFDVFAGSQLFHDGKSVSQTEWIVSGKAPAHVDPNYYNPKDRQHVIYNDTLGCNGMRFQYRIKVQLLDGNVTTDTSGLHIQDASEVFLYVAAATSFNGFYKCPDSQGKDEKKATTALIEKALQQGYPALLKSHLADYQTYFNRVSFSVKDTTVTNINTKLPSDERLQDYSNGAYDPFIETLYFQYGRYLLISSSRPGGPPANLQGIWNKELRAPWSSNYTININTQMNYWPAEVTNLSEMHEPLLNWIKDLSVTGRRTAKEFYNAKGWVAHHNSDIWCLSNPVGDVGAGDPVWANWYMGANWLTRHLWEHYQYTGDKKFLSDFAYPVMKEAALFTLDWLIKDSAGYLVTAPSTSPENLFKNKKGGNESVSVATTMDMAIIWDLFTNLIEASKALGSDSAFRNVLIDRRTKLYPMQIGSKGQLLEWYKDFPENDPLHRHVSHLFGLYPGRQITMEDNNNFFNAAKKTLELRGDAGTGWSKGWKINWWARLLDGDHAYTLIRQLLRYVDNKPSNQNNTGGTYPNFFDAHPPFQIDGNFAGTSGMAEMLLQSHLNEIHLLPALPAAWKTGSIKGLRARGAFEVDMQWNNHELVSAKLKSIIGGTCKIRSSKPIVIKSIKTLSVKTDRGYLTSFLTQKKTTYQIIVQ
jgi:alpha-L-fucosidase 2